MLLREVYHLPNKRYNVQHKFGGCAGSFVIEN
jgi:hypothetical protein